MEISEQHQQYDIIHEGDFDIVVNRAHDQIGFVEEALDLIEESIKNNPDDPLVEWEKAGRWNTRYQTSKRGQKFLLKQRKVSMNDYQLSVIHKYHETGETGELTQNDMRRLHHFDSLLNEFSLWKKIKAILDSEEVQNAVRTQGFAGIDLIEPLAGFIDRRKRMKCVVYEFVPGEVGAIMDNLDKGDPLSDFLEEIFKRAGIEPNDIHYKQFITTGSDQEKRVHLIDVEGYINSKRAHSSTTA